MSSSDVGVLQEWLKKQPHLPKIEERRLVLFIYRANSSVEGAKKYIENYYTIRSRIPEIFTCRNPLSPEIQKVFQRVLLCCLSGDENNMPYIGYVKIIDKDVQDTFEDECRVMDMMASYLSSKSKFSDRRSLIIDTKGFDFTEVKKWKLPLVTKYIYYCQNAVPMVVDGVHILHLSPVAEFVFNLLRPLINEEYKDKVYLHATVDSLCEHVPRDILPMEYGGKAGTFEQLKEKSIKQMVEHADYFKKEEIEDVVDETKRIGKVPDMDDIFSVDGTFRKLEID